MTIQGVTVTNITAEAKQTLSFAMSNFCKPARVKSEMELWIESRSMEIRINEGLDKSEADEQAKAEWSQK